MHKLIVFLIEAAGNGRIQGGPGVKSFLSLFPVRALHVLEKAVEVALFPAEIRLGQCAVLLIGLADFAHADGILNDALILHEQRGVDQAEHLLSELPHKICAERTLRQSRIPLLVQRDQAGILLADPLHFRFIEGITGIDGVAD